MYRITQQIDFCYGHRLLNYAGKCRNLHGHNGRVQISLEAADLDNRGMLIDFTDIKKSIATWIDSERPRLIRCSAIRFGTVGTAHTHCFGPRVEVV